MKRIILIAIAIVLVASCKPKHIYVTDTIYHTNHVYETVIDTIVDVRVETEFVDRFTEDTMSELTTELAVSRALLINGMLYHSLLQEGYTEAEIVYRDVYRYDTIYKYRTEVEEVEIEKKLSTFQKLLMWIGILSIISLAMYLVVRYYKYLR